MFKVLLFVRVEGLEPPRREALDPKSSVATNYTTPALDDANVMKIFYLQIFDVKFLKSYR